MSTVEEIEMAVKRLPETKLAQLTKWFDDFVEEHWDAKMKADAKSGALDQLAAEAKTEKKTGKLRRFPN